MDIAGMVLGILAIVFVSWTPIDLAGKWTAVPLVVVGLPLSVVSFQNARRNNTRSGIAIAGMVTNLVAALLFFAW